MPNAALYKSTCMPAMFVAVIFASMQARAADWYVATNGLDTAAGSEDAPVATISKAHTLASEGDTIHIAPGIYALASGTTVTKNGLSFVGDGDTAADVVIDGQGSCRAFVVKGATGLTFANFTIRNTSYTSASGILVGSNESTPVPIATAGNNLFSNLVFRACTNSNTSTSARLYKSGGALFAAPCDTVDHCVFEDCSGGYAGGVVADCTAGNVTFRGCEFRRCNSVALYGRNHATDGSHRLILENCVFEDNPARAGFSGGVSATGCTFARNAAADGADGGAWYSDSDVGTPYDFIGCTFTANTATRGGVFASNLDNSSSKPVLTFSNCTFRANSSSGEGAVAAHCTGNVNTLRTIFAYDCEFEENAAGGGYVLYARVLTMERCAFLRNVSDGDYNCAALNANCSAIGCRFEGNRTTDAYAGTLGATLGIPGTNTLVRNCLFLTNVNESASGQAAALFRNSKTAYPTVVESCTFAGNTCRTATNGYQAGGIGAATDSRDGWAIVNCAFLDNKVGDETRNLPCPGNSGNKGVIRNGCTNCFENATSTYALLSNGTNGNIVNTALTVADLFADYAAGDLMPSKGSILRNAGVNRDWMTAMAFDLTGKNLRINPGDKVDDSAIVDIGCYEWFVKLTGLILSFR